MDKLIKECCTYIDVHIHENISVESLAKEFGYSKFHFSRLFSNNMELSLSNYIRNQKLSKAAVDILNGSSVLDAAIAYGYDTHNGFGKAFKKYFGYSPSMLLAIRLTDTIISNKGVPTMSKDELYNTLLESINSKATNKDVELLNTAYTYATKAHEGMKRYSGDEYVTHPLNVAIILSRMDAPIETIILGILHDCNELDSNKSLEQVKESFGNIYYKKLQRINELKTSANLLNEVDFKIEEDIILVKLADRLHNMQTLKYLNEGRWQDKAKETISIFSPLANAVGNTELKATLDKLSLEFIA